MPEAAETTRWYTVDISSPFTPPVKKLFSLSRKQRFVLYIAALLIYGVYTSFFQPQNTIENPNNAQKTPASVPTAIPAQLTSDTYLVTKIVDGDTIEVAELDATAQTTDIRHTVRYIGIDTPETVAPGKAVQCYGKEASARNAELVLNHYVRLEKDKSDTDRYGRWLRYAYAGAELPSESDKTTEVFINMTLVREGYAHAHAYAPDIAHKTDFKAAEDAAKSEKAGLWGACI